MSTLKLNSERVVVWQDAPGGVSDATVHFGRDDAGAGAIQIGVATVLSRPNRALLDALHKSRASKSPLGFIVAAVAPEGVWIHYPTSGAPAVEGISIAQAERQLQSVLDEDDGLAAHSRMRAIQDALASQGSAGFSNHFLFSGYYLDNDVRTRPDWADAQQRAGEIASLRGPDLVRALGFEAAEASSDRVLVLRASAGPRRAVAVLLRDDEHFDQKSAAYQLTPVAKAMEVAGREDVPWVIGLRKSTLRLYPGRDGVGVGQRGQSETYFELDLGLIDPDQVALLTLIFSADALKADGSTQQILDGSGKYAAALGTRLRDRVYEGVVPRLALGIADRLPEIGLKLDGVGLQMAYRLTMRILFRLLFQAYGEATELLPAGRNDHYDANSLQAFIGREIGTDAGEFSTESAAIWSDLTQVWEVIFHGNTRWEVPAYGGSLFDPVTEEGELLSRIKLPDSIIGPALQELLSEQTDDGSLGPVDFRSLQVREFGTIYEGLLESSLSLAGQDLAVDRNGAYVPAKEGDVVEAAAGQPYFHSASGERKATGSYYTPKIVVDHLIERSVEPALEAHLGRIRSLLDEGNERKASEQFFDFRVADLAMGSAHFLVAAVDKIERGMRDFLTVTDVPGVRAELSRLADKAREALGADTEGAKSITDGQLLRRQVARRCIYGLDINPLAVELSRLALWIHTFVPGLPMSSLDHGLVLANSLTGIGTIEEALEALNADGLFERIIRGPLTAARDLLVDYANASEADKSEVAAGAEMLSKAKEAAAPAKAIFDVAVARRLGVTIDEAWDAAQFVALAAMREVCEAVDPLQPAHMPYLFPEVFLRERPGFDVLVGNPPWETVKVEEQKWWGMRVPGLRSMKQQERRSTMLALFDQRPDLVAEYEKDQRKTEALAIAIRRGPYKLGAGDFDLYQAFAWRFWNLIRSGGLSAVVLPRAAFSGSPLEHWRRKVLAEGSFADVCFLQNKAEWIFRLPNGTRLTIGLGVIGRGGDSVARFSGPFANEAEFIEGAGNLIAVPADEFVDWSEIAAFPLMREPISGEVFMQMKGSPRFDSQYPGWDFRLANEMHSTADRALYDFDVSRPHDTAVMTGSSFNLWNPNFGSPYAYVDNESVVRHLSAKLASSQRQKRSPYRGIDFGAGTMVDRPRIAFRKISRSDDSRTTIACLLPAGIPATEAAQVIVRGASNVEAEAYLLGVLSSIPFDWAARKWVESNFNFFVMKPLPVPRYLAGSTLVSRVGQVAGRLAAIDDRYSDWAADVGVEVGTANDEPTKSELIAELDALVSLLYGLSAEQVEHIFATFHRGWDYSARLERVLAYYEQWKDAA